MYDVKNFGMGSLLWHELIRTGSSGGRISTVVLTWLSVPKEQLQKQSDIKETLELRVPSWTNPQVADVTLALFALPEYTASSRNTNSSKYTDVDTHNHNSD